MHSDRLNIGRGLFLLYFIVLAFLRPPLEVQQTMQTRFFCVLTITSG